MDYNYSSWTFSNVVFDPKVKEEFFALKIDNKYVREVYTKDSSFAALVTRYVTLAKRFSYSEAIESKVVLEKHPILKSPIELYKISIEEELTV